MHGLRHLLTPGTPTYAVAKLTAVGGAVALRSVARRRGPRDHAEAEASPTPSRSDARRPPHPRSKKKRRPRRR